MSYLSDRYQYVYVNSINSTTEKIISGVPQGSILGSLLFCLLINIANATANDIFADDSSLYSSDKQLTVIKQILIVCACVHVVVGVSVSIVSVCEKKGRGREGERMGKEKEEGEREI